MTNKIEHVSTYGTETVKQRITNKEYGTFIFVSRFNIADGLKTLIDQWFEPLKLFHNAYEAQRMPFSYYGREINPVADYDLLENDKLEPVIIEDIESFSDFDKLYCNWLGMDNNIYSLTNKNPLPSVQYLEVWGSYYDLAKVQKHLSTISCVVKAEIKNNIYQNWDISGLQTLHIRYVPDVKMIKKMVKIKDHWSRDEWVKKELGLEQFKYPEPQYP